MGVFVEDLPRSGFWECLFRGRVSSQHSGRRKGSVFIRRADSTCAHPVLWDYDMLSRDAFAALVPMVLGIVLVKGEEAGRQTEIRLEELDLASIQQGVGLAKKNASIEGGPISIGGKTFEHGIGTHARSEMRVLLDGKATRLAGLCGLDDASAKDSAASVEFEIVADGAVVWRSGVLKAGSAAVAFDVPLEKARDVRLKVGDAGDGMAADRADWADAVIRFSGQSPQAVAPADDGLASQLPPVKEAQGGPPNVPAEVKWEAANGYLQVLYGKKLLFRGTLANGASIESRSNGERAVEQRIIVANGGEALNLIVHGGKEALAAETRGEPQKRFPLVRTALGPSDNLRNNAVYDPEGDWMIEFPAEISRIVGLRATDQTMRFEVKIAARDAQIVFRPRFFQKHKNLPYYQPWATNLRLGIPSGWNVASAYPEKPNAAEFARVLETWKTAHFGDYGAPWIEFEALPPPPKKPVEGKKKEEKTAAVSPSSAPPETGAKPEPPKPPAFPGGTKAMAELVVKAGALPAVRINAEDWTTAVFRDFAKQGIGLFRAKGLDRSLYRAHETLADWVKQKRRPEEGMRTGLAVAKKDGGRDSLLAADGGVLPEAIGLVDIARLNRDGFSPVAMQQFNSWNGLVWRNDPGPCDVLPGGLPVPAEPGAEAKSLTDAQLQAAVLRPALVSIGGGVLMLADPPAVYRDERLLKGVRKSLPVIASVPGQLYDFDETKTAWFRTGERTGLRGEDAKSPTDADPAGTVCSWWLNEFDTTAGHWNVLHRVNAGEAALPGTTVRFADLGIDPKKGYLVYEFWSEVFLGVCRDSFDIPALGANGLQSYVIREAFDRPQIISTNRHLSQGAVDLELIGWDDATATLSARSRVVADDRYTVTLDVPAGYRPMDATVGDQSVEVENRGRFARLSFVSPQSGPVVWSVRFVR